LKYEFIRLSDDFKNNKNFFYQKDQDDRNYLDLGEILDANKSLRFPIAIFINGVLLESSLYEFKNKIITFKGEYPIYSTDRIYLLMASTNMNNGGYVKQYICKNFAVYEDDNNSIIIDSGGFEFSSVRDVIGVIINGVLYGRENFEIEYNLDLGYTKLNAMDKEVPARKDKITFNYEVNNGMSIRPEVTDDLSILILEREYAN